MKNIFFWGGKGGSVGRGAYKLSSPEKGGGGLLEGEGLFKRGALQRIYVTCIPCCKWSWQSRFLRCINFTAESIVINCL